MEKAQVTIKDPTLAMFETVANSLEKNWYILGGGLSYNDKGEIEHCKTVYWLYEKIRAFFAQNVHSYFGSTKDHVNQSEVQKIIKKALTTLSKENLGQPQIAQIVKVARKAGLLLDKGNGLESGQTYQSIQEILGDGVTRKEKSKGSKSLSDSSKSVSNDSDHSAVLDEAKEVVNQTESEVKPVIATEQKEPEVKPVVIKDQKEAEIQTDLETQVVVITEKKEAEIQTEPEVKPVVVKDQKEAEIQTDSETQLVVVTEKKEAEIQTDPEAQVVVVKKPTSRAGDFDLDLPPSTPTPSKTPEAKELPTDEVSGWRDTAIMIGICAGGLFISSSEPFPIHENSLFWEGAAVIGGGLLVKKAISFVASVLTRPADEDKVVGWKRAGLVMIVAGAVFAAEPFVPSAWHENIAMGALWGLELLKVGAGALKENSGYIHSFVNEKLANLDGSAADALALVNI
jgi:hypothetical protein